LVSWVTSSRYEKSQAQLISRWQKAIRQKIALNGFCHEMDLGASELGETNCFIAFSDALSDAEAGRR
jgi:hypothetical protein